MKHPRLVLFSGAHDAGKSITCHHLMEQALRAGRQTAGILSPGVYFQGKKIGIAAMDAQTEDYRILASLRNEDDDGDIQTIHWRFDNTALEWGDAVLASACPCDILIVDELGPLELVRGEGWQAGLAALDSRAYRVAVAVIRPELLAQAFARFAPCMTLTIASPSEKDAVVDFLLEL